MRTRSDVDLWYSRSFQRVLYAQDLFQVTAKSVDFALTRLFLSSNLVSTHLHVKDQILMERKPTEVRQEEIKKAVLSIIDQEGMHNLSTRKVAERVGVSEGALFRHFRTKRDMILALVDEVEEVLMKSLRDVAAEESPAEDRLLRFLCTHVRYLTANKGITILLFSEAAHANDPELKARMLKILNEQKRLAKKIVNDGISAGDWDDSINVDHFATLYMGIPISLNIELVLSPGGVNTDNFCKKMLAVLERALKPVK